MSGPRLNPDLMNVPLYIAGKSIEEVKEELGLSSVIKLASNESPIGPSPLAMQAAECMLQQAHRYPGIAERDLRRKLAAKLDGKLEEGHIVVGNGGTDVLRMITQAFVFDGGNTVMSRVTFPMYHILTSTFGGTCRQVEPTRELHHDLAAMADMIDEDTRLVYLCSPNNPTGLIITQVEADEFIARVPPHVVVVFDESYHDYVTDPAQVNSLAYIEDGHNVLSVRSFSKVSGLANLRVGYLIGPVTLANYVRRTSLPFHSGDIALVAAAASLDDSTYQIQHLKVVREGREFLYEALHKLGLASIPSQANFQLIMNLPVEAVTLADALLHRGIVVRPMSAFGMPEGIRVTVGKPDDNQQFIAGLQQVLEAYS